MNYNQIWWGKLVVNIELQNIEYEDRSHKIQNICKKKIYEDWSQVDPKGEPERQLNHDLARYLE